MERPLEFSKLIKSHPIVALTATPGKRTFEKEVLEALDFNVYLKPPIKLMLEPMRTEGFTIDNFLSFLISSDQPMLIFCSEEQMKEYMKIPVSVGARHFVNYEITGETAHHDG